MKRLNLFILMITLELSICVPILQAETFGGIEFPNGAVSFADEVIDYNNMYSGGPAPTLYLDPQTALGPPDYKPGTGKSVSLGRGGKIELKFVNNYLVNSGDDSYDLHVFEVGTLAEDTFVAIRPTPDTTNLLNPNDDLNGDGFYEIGKIYGATSSIDIDFYFPGFSAEELVFDAVQLIDDPNEGDISGPYVGADIDAVGAIGTVRLCDYYLIGDLDFDCDVDLEDFALMAVNWLVDCELYPDHPSCIPLQ